jgi:hypothetical protein
MKVAQVKPKLRMMNKSNQRKNLISLKVSSQKYINKMLPQKKVYFSKFKDKSLLKN